LVIGAKGPELGHVFGGLWEPRGSGFFQAGLKNVPAAVQKGVGSQFLTICLRMEPTKGQLCQELTTDPFSLILCRRSKCGWKHRFAEGEGEDFAVGDLPTARLGYGFEVFARQSADPCGICVPVTSAAQI